MLVKYYDWAEYQAHTRPNKVAIKETANDCQTTYHQLNERSSRLASWLQKKGLNKGDRVAILANNCKEVFELEFACGKIGGIELPLNWRLTKPELEYILNDSSPEVLIYSENFSEIALKLIQDCNISHSLKIDAEDSNSEYEQALSEGIDFKKVEMSHDDVIMLMYTSGTTGHPKGAMITHQMQFYNIVNLGGTARITDKSIQLVALPLFHTGGMNCYANPILHSGGQIILMSEFDPGEALNIINDPDYGVTHFFAVPAPFQFMMQHPEFESTDFSRLEGAGVGGAPCAEIIIKNWQDKGVEMWQGWGMTETSPGGIGLPGDDAARKIGSAGKPLLHTEVKIVREDGKEVEKGEVGEILIKGPNVTPGYWNNEKATKESFIDGWLKTGDAAQMDDEGFIYIVDRQKDMYISGGENVYPAEIENVIYQLPQIAEAAIIGVPDKKWGETGMAFISIKDGMEISEEEIINHCLKNLAKFKIPNSIKFIEALPRNATGKVLKRTLREETLGENAPAIS
tara:strand:+ start:5356 stop:6897 length:1542 start_codon:yes stop_codon:yes gene_type:complete